MLYGTQKDPFLLALALTSWHNGPSILLIFFMLFINLIDHFGFNNESKSDKDNRVDTISFLLLN